MVLLTAAILALTTSAADGDPSLLLGLLMPSEKVVMPVVAPDGSAKVELTKKIDDKAADAFIAQMDAVLAGGATKIELLIDSPGGDFNQAARMARAIERAAAKKVAVECTADGEAMSLAFYLLQSCPVRKMTARSVLMAHEPYLSEIVGNRKEIAQALEMIRYMSVQYSAQCAARMHMSVKEFQKRIYRKDWYITPEEALSLGAIDEVIPSPNAAMAVNKCAPSDDPSAP